VRAIGWVSVGQVATHLIRLASNLALTRLLFPEAFGLMAIVTALMTGVQLLSDFGVAPSVIQNERGEEARFLDTAWSVQVVRGLVIALVVAMLAWPLGRFYGEPSLVGLVAVSGLTAAIQGFQSMSLVLLQRRLLLGKLISVELATQLGGLVVSLWLAWWLQSVWALLAGWLVGAALRTAVSHLLSESPRHRLRWDTDAAASMYRFGRWVFLTTPLAFLLNHGDRMLLGRFLPMEALGVYAIGVLLVQAVWDVSNQIGVRVLFPLYSEVGRSDTPQFRRRVAYVRGGLQLAFLPPLCLLAAAGDWVVELLYDDRYAAAGWITRIMAASTIPGVVGRIGPVFMARGETVVGLLGTLVPAIGTVVGIVVGGRIAGGDGMIVGIALGKVFHYPAQIWIARRYGLWMPAFEFAGLAISAGVIAGVVWLRGVLG
jgi:O-antigen/teichoic acid export membrane protein